MAEYHEWLVDIRGVNLGSLDNSSQEDEGRDLLKYVSDNEDNWPSRILEKADLERLLAEAMEKMPMVERTVLSLYYHEELTLREIAKVVRLHESRVSQLKSQAILRLRAYIEKRWPIQKGDRSSLRAPVLTNVQAAGAGLGHGLAHYAKASKAGD